MTIPNMKLSEARREEIEPGGYIVEVISTYIDTKYNRLQLQIDIADGPNAGYYMRLQERANFWGLTANLSLDEKDAWKFKNAVDAMRDSDPSFIWEDDADNEESEMVGVKVGAITQRRHYMGNDGKKKSKLLVYRLVPVDVIKTGEYEVPDDIYADDFPKAMPATGQVVDTTAADPVKAFGELKDDDMPFA